MNVDRLVNALRDSRVLASFAFDSKLDGDLRRYFTVYDVQKEATIPNKNCVVLACKIELESSDGEEFLWFDVQIVALLNPAAGRDFISACAAPSSKVQISFSCVGERVYIDHSTAMEVKVWVKSAMDPIVVLDAHPASMFFCLVSFPALNFLLHCLTTGFMEVCAIPISYQLSGGAMTWVA